MGKNFKKVAQLPLYPVLMNFYFVFFVFQANHYQLLIPDTFDYLLITTAGMVVVIAVARFLPLGLFSVVGAALFFGLVYFALPFQVFHDLRAGGLRLITHLILAGSFLCIAVLVLIRRGHFAHRVAGAFNFGAMVALLWSMGGFAYEYLTLTPRDITLANPVIEVTDKPAPVRPHIVHIMLDGYSRQDVLAQDYGFDNNDFLAALRARGFKIAPGATTPYNQTTLSLAATFQGGYLDHDKLAALDENDVWLRRRLMDKITDGPVHEILKRQGYAFFATSVGLTGFYHYPDDTMLLGAMSQGRRWTFEQTFLYNRNVKSITPLADWITWRGLQQLNQDVRFSFDFSRFGAPIAAALSAGKPIHLYQHILSPHPPFTITSEGEDTKAWLPYTRYIATGNAIIYGQSARRKAYAAGYLEKLRYTNQALLAHIDHLVAAIPEPRVIIVQSDL